MLSVRLASDVQGVQERAGVQGARPSAGLFPGARQRQEALDRVSSPPGAQGGGWAPPSWLSVIPTSLPNADVLGSMFLKHGSNND